MISVANRIAVLGWGSLIWDPRPAFNRQVGPWEPGGPQLAIEFCRISESRRNALTLVIDSHLGTPVETLYTISKRSDINEAIADLRLREGTSPARIGYVNRASSVEHGRDARVVEAIGNWAEVTNIQSVIWTDLPSNFPEREPDRFIDAALTHLRSLSPEGIQKSVEYIVKAPPQMTTRLRAAIMNNDWFKDRVSEYLRAQK